MVVDELLIGASEFELDLFSEDVEVEDRWRRKIKASYSLLERLRNSRRITRRMTPMQEKANWACVWMCQLLARKPWHVVLVDGKCEEGWCCGLQESIVYQFHNMETLQVSGPILIPAIVCVALVATADTAVFVLDVVGRGNIIDEAMAVAIVMALEPISIFVLISMAVVVVVDDKD
jgi:hypothetical protein